MKSRISVVFLIFCLMIGSFVYSIALAEQPYSQGGSAQQDGINTGSPTNPSALDEARLFLPAQGKVPVFPINRESGQQLSEAAKDEVKAIVAREFDGYKNHITDIKTMSFSFMGGTSLIIAVFAAIHGLQSYYARKDSKELMDTLEKKMANITNKYLSIAQETISATIASTEARLRLTREITDLDDPSIRRSDEEISTAEIKNFLWAVATQKDMVEKTFKTLPESGKDSEGMPHLQDSIFDHRIIGKAHAYIKDYDKAIECFQKEIELLEKEKGKSKDNSLIERLGKELDEARLRLGNSYAGNSDYRQAIKQYDKMGDEKNLNIRKHLSKAHAYKNLVDFNKAVKACRSAIDSYKHCYPDPAGTSFSDAKGDRKRYIAARCYWESKYELANSLVALGEYESAAEEYKNLCDKIARQEIRDAVDPVWLYLSYGECLWKGKRDYKDIEDILKQYEESDRNAPSEEKGKILYKRGRLLISSGKLHEAEKSFYEIEDYGYNVGDDCDRFKLFYGYTMSKNKQNNKDRREEGEAEIDQAVRKMKRVKKEAEGKYRSNGHSSTYSYLICYPNYNLAMGLAMQGGKRNKEKTIELLEELISRYEFEFVKEWAKAADCADFPDLKSDEEFRKLVGLTPTDNTTS